MEKNKLSVPISEKYLLTCREAALYFNLGVKNLRCMARNPTLKIGLLLHGRFLIVRPRFEEYILQLMEDNFLILNPANTATKTLCDNSTDVAVMMIQSRFKATVQSCL